MENGVQCVAYLHKLSFSCFRRLLESFYSFGTTQACVEWQIVSAILRNTRIIQFFSSKRNTKVRDMRPSLDKDYNSFHHLLSLG